MNCNTLSVLVIYKCTLTSEINFYSVTKDVRDSVVTEFGTYIYLGSKTNPERTSGKIKYYYRWITYGINERVDQINAHL